MSEGIRFSKPCYFLNRPPYGFYHFMDNYKRRDYFFFDLWYTVVEELPQDLV